MTTKEKLKHLVHVNSTCVDESVGAWLKPYENGRLEGARRQMFEWHLCECLHCMALYNIDTGDMFEIHNSEIMRSGFSLHGLRQWFPSSRQIIATLAIWAVVAGLGVGSTWSEKSTIAPKVSLPGPTLIASTGVPGVPDSANAGDQVPDSKAPEMNRPHRVKNAPPKWASTDHSISMVGHEDKPVNTVQELAPEEIGTGQPSIESAALKPATVIALGSNPENQPIIRGISVPQSERGKGHTM